MKIAFHNRQRKLKLDLVQMQEDFQSLSEALGQNLLARPPNWLPKKALRPIFERGSLSLVIVSDRAIRQVNKEWRAIDRATDVLSFPLELVEPPVFMNDHDEDNSWIVGEIIISAQKASAQAEEYGHSLRRELAFLFIHGCLHILGFDHESAAEEKEMFGRQREILSIQGFSRKA